MVTKQQWLVDVRRAHIIDPIDNDSRNTGTRDTRLGHPVDWIFHHAIGGGQADFDQPIRGLSPRDRVMLYALFNQKAHVDELIHAFQRLVPEPALMHGATVLDIGCGPFTAGLALASVVGNGVAFRYVGVDHSRAMRDFGRELASAASASGGINARSTVEFSRSVDDVEFGPSRSEWTVVVLSYLLASTTLDVEQLADQIARACDRIGIGPVAVLYTNTGRPGARTKFPELVTRLAKTGFVKRIEEEERWADGDKRRDIHYALFVRAPVATIALSRLTS